MTRREPSIHDYPATGDGARAYNTDHDAWERAVRLEPHVPEWRRRAMADAARRGHVAVKPL